ncbi:MAG: helix-turn-helix transcriptional regulator [Clostridia bacterium]|nr:helix-turn-helix transcriptional regulator [Clostridia bacterium]
MGISYKKLWVLLIEKDITRAKIRRDLKIATGTMSKLNKGEEVALSVLLRICDYLDCDIGDICSVVKPKKEDTV